MAKIPVFLDTDVIISSLLSQTGASFAIIHNPAISKQISLSIKQELREVATRLNLNPDQTHFVLEQCHMHTLNLTKAPLINKYARYVIDPEDMHVVAGSHLTKSKFLLTHNLKHYQIDAIAQKLGIVVMKPGQFLQYLRSQKH